MSVSAGDNNRVFDPLNNFRGSSSTVVYRHPSDIIFYDSQHAFSRLMYYVLSEPTVPRVDNMSAVVAVDGACRGGGTDAARATFGIYCGPDSRYNFSGRLPRYSAFAFGPYFLAIPLQPFTLGNSLLMTEQTILSDKPVSRALRSYQRVGSR